MTEQTTLQSLTRRRIALIAAYAVTVAAYAAAILLILVDLRYAVAVVNVATLFYLLVVRRMDKRYELAFANASMRYGCGHCLQDVAVKTKARDALSHAQVEQMSLLPTREAGGVATSGLEMTQNSIRLTWSPEEVDAKLKSIMQNIHSVCVHYGTQPDGYINYVVGANIGGFMKVANAMLAQGCV